MSSRALTPPVYKRNSSSDSLQNWQAAKSIFAGGYIWGQQCCFWTSVVLIISINPVTGVSSESPESGMGLKSSFKKKLKKNLTSMATGSGLLYVHYRGELQQWALRPNGAAFRVQFLQVLQKASPLETLENDGVAGGQADASPAQGGESKGHVRLTSIHEYASWSKVMMCSRGPSVHPHPRVQREVSVREEALSSPLITALGI